MNIEYAAKELVTEALQKFGALPDGYGFYSGPFSSYIAIFRVETYDDTEVEINFWRHEAAIIGGQDGATRCPYEDPEFDVKVLNVVRRKLYADRNP